MAGFLLAREVQRREVEGQFRAAAQDHAEAVGLGLERGFETVLLLRDHFGAGPAPVDEDSFHAFAGPTVARRPYIQALQWLPEVTPANRATLEASSRSRHPTFRFFERSPDGSVTELGREERFHAVLFSEPLKGNEAALGYSARRIPTRQAMIAQALRSGGLSASGRIVLIQEPADQFGILVVAPVPGSARRPPGLVQGVFRCGDLVAKSLAFLEPKGIDLRLEDASAPAAESLLHEETTRLPRGHGASSGLRFVRNFQLAGRTWRVAASAAPGHYPMDAGARAWVVLVAGLAFTLLLAKVLADLLARETQDRALVEARTRDLAAEVDSHRRDAAALADTEARLRQLVQLMGEGMWVVDPAGRTTFVNRRMEEMLGVEVGGMIGRLPQEWLFPEDEQAQGELFRSGALQPVQRELRLRRSDGRELWVILSRNPILGPGGDPQGTIGILTDITARRHAEDALRQSQKLESLGVLAGGIAHDFNNLLTAIMGNLSLARLRVLDDAPALDYMDKIERIVHRASNLTRQMLAYSGKGRFVVASLDLNQTVQEMSHLLEVSLPKKVQLRCELARGLPPMLADAAQIQQVVMNLVTNAAEAIGDAEGTVTIRTGLESCGPDVVAADAAPRDLGSGSFLSLEVADTGQGMSPEVQARIFEPFFTTKFAGRGLGLSAMQGIVRGHGGAIRIRSEVGRGTVFKLLFPVSSEPVRSPEPPSEPAGAWTGTGAVLVVDDEEAVRSASQELLRILGFEVESAEDGREAVARVRAEPGRFRAVLMDLTMPHLNGVEAFQEIRKIDPGCKVVLTSGYEEAEALQAQVGRSLAGFLQKPFRLEELRSAMRAALGE